VHSGSRITKDVVPEDQTFTAAALYEKGSSEHEALKSKDHIVYSGELPSFDSPFKNSEADVFTSS